MNKFLDITHYNFDILQSVAGRLCSISKSFRNIGNDALAQELFILSSDIMIARDAIDKAISNDISRQSQAAIDNSAILLKTVLAGAQIEKERL
jgi:hypothetical protein